MTARFALIRPHLTTLAIVSLLILSVRADAADVLAREVLRNAEYDSRWAPSGRVRLRHGHHREPAAPGSASEIRVSLLDQMVRWKANGRSYAGVILATDPGGSGTFYELIVVEARGGRPVEVASADLGDRVRVQSLTVERGAGPPAISVGLVVHGPDDPLCCPTQLAVRRFVWRAGALVSAK